MRGLTHTLDLDDENNVAITEVFVVDPDDAEEVVTVRFATEVQEDDPDTGDAS